MKVDVTTVGSYQKKLQITVPAATVKDELDQAYKRWAKRAKLKGFRPGKVPRQVLEGRFGPQVRSEVADQLRQSAYQDALSEHGIEPVGRPVLATPGTIKRSTDFEFILTVDVRPEVSLDNYKGAKVVFPKVEVTEEELDAAIAQQLEGHARLVEITDRAAESGDMVMVELKVTQGEEELVQEPGTMIRTAGDPYYAGIEELLIGLSVGEEKTGSVTFSEDARSEEVKGQEGEATVKVISIQANEVPELDDAIAEELGHEGGATGMRAAVQLRMAEGREALARNQARANVLQVLIETNPFEVPDSMVETMLQMLTDELKQQQGYRSNRDPRTISFTEAQLADLRGRAEFAAKAGIILEFVAKTEKLEVGETELDGKYEEIAEQQGATIEAVRGWYKREEGLVSELQDRLLEEKTLDWLLENAELIDAPDDAPEAPTDALKELAATIIQEEVDKKAAKKKAAAADASEEAAAADPEPAPEATPEAAPEVPADDAAQNAEEEG